MILFLELLVPVQYWTDMKVELDYQFLYFEVRIKLLMEEKSKRLIGK